MTLSFSPMKLYRLLYVTGNVPTLYTRLYHTFLLHSRQDSQGRSLLFSRDQRKIECSRQLSMNVFFQSLPVSPSLRRTKVQTQSSPRTHARVLQCHVIPDVCPDVTNEDTCTVTTTSYSNKSYNVSTLLHQSHSCTSISQVTVSHNLFFQNVTQVYRNTESTLS